ncbi:hypothetical protein HYE67_009171 [Fusarium culmorum]|uniref:Uncharacterized protein n=1 Tax=Fusarium culmorum TaxID=5516 RepID=A0A2T4H649_FUSCU|nr:hypothetical protein FCULG_00003888 [Fusarium culmorum]QPC66940.1 hypothetical protein HYE67_009171 [Fusarium culmorum]
MTPHPLSALAFEHWAVVPTEGRISNESLCLEFDVRIQLRSSLWEELQYHLPTVWEGWMSMYALTPLVTDTTLYQPATGGSTSATGDGRGKEPVNAWQLLESNVNIWPMPMECLVRSEIEPPSRMADIVGPVPRRRLS